MVHNPTCGCPKCFHINYPDQPNPHRTHSYRVNRKVDYQVTTTSSHVAPKDSYDWVQHGSITFYTECWWCGEPVYFHRNEDGGCVLFDRLGPPWPIHSCWEEHKNQQKTATKTIVEKRVAELRAISISSYKFINEKISKQENIEGFILGFDEDKRILPDPNQLSKPNLFLRYVVVRTMDGSHIKILAPEKDIKEIVMYSYANIFVERHIRRNSITLLCFRSIESKNIDSTGTQSLELKYDYKRVINMPWTYQESLKKKS